MQTPPDHHPHNDHLSCLDEEWLRQRVDYPPPTPSIRDDIVSFHWSTRFPYRRYRFLQGRYARFQVSALSRLNMGTLTEIEACTSNVIGTAIEDANPAPGKHQGCNVYLNSRGYAAR